LKKLKGPKPRTPQTFRLIPALLDGKPIVQLDFGRFGQINLDADDVERFKNHIDAELRAAKRLGEI
jgi:hypothetical protein